MKRQVRAVSFDAAGTLFRVKGSVAEVYAGQAARFGALNATEPAVLDRIRQSFRSALGRMPPLAFPGRTRQEVRSLEIEWWRRVVRESMGELLPEGRFDEFFQELFDTFRRSDAWVLEPGCRQVLQQLKERGLKLGVISNFDSRLEELIEGFQLEHLFQAVVYSSRAGAAKPELAIFRQAAEELGVSPSEALHVGDDPQADLAGARAAGFQALLYDPAGRWSRRHMAVRVGRLTDVCEYLV